MGFVAGTCLSSITTRCWIVTSEINTLQIKLAAFVQVQCSKIPFRSQLVPTARPDSNTWSYIALLALEAYNSLDRLTVHVLRILRTMATTDDLCLYNFEGFYEEFQGLRRKQTPAGQNIFCFTDQQQDQLSGHETHFCVTDGCIVGHFSSFAQLICLNCLKWTGVEMKSPNCLLCNWGFPDNCV